MDFGATELLFYQGAPSFHDLCRAEAPAQLAELARGHLSAAGQQQIACYLRMLGALEAELNTVRRRLVSAARSVRGACTRCTQAVCSARRS